MEDSVRPARLFQKFLSSPWPVLGVFVLLVASLAIMAESTQRTGYFHPWQEDIFKFNMGLLLLLLGLAIYSSFNLSRRLRKRETGSRLTERIARTFVGFAVVPAGLILLFSLWVLSIGIDSWFDVGVDSALLKSQRLSQSAIENTMREHLRYVQRLVDEASQSGSTKAAVSLTNDLVSETGAAEAVLIDSKYRIISAQSESFDIAHQLPNAQKLRLLWRSPSYLEQIDHPRYGPTIYLLQKVRLSSLDDPLVLQVLYPISKHMNNLITSVEQAADSYRVLLEQRQPLIYSLNILIVLTLVMGGLFALWAGAHYSQHILSPIPELARGIEAVASGNYRQTLPTRHKDELAQLVLAFNRMIVRLAENREIIEQQRQELEILLQTIPSGVLSVNQDGRLMMANPAAANILGYDLTPYLGQLPQDVPEIPEGLRSLWESTQVKSHGPQATDQKIYLHEGRTTLLCHSTVLPQSIGTVVVFVNITALQQAQRQETWEEAARRMAHEIKNPLTPIRLSAERLQYKLIPKLQGEDTELLRKCTDTIVTQVESMRDMLNEFSEYASVEYSPELIEFDPMVREVLNLYQEPQSNTHIELVSHTEGIEILTDRKRVWQLLHNLIKNALEAQEGQDTATIRLRTEARDGNLVLQVCDDGPGFDPEILPRIFEPYVTTKPGGNGLGLAIVHKIMQDHGGQVRVYNGKSSGGCVEVRFPYPPPPLPLETNRRSRGLQ